jgi:hypothetical protein
MKVLLLPLQEPGKKKKKKAKKKALSSSKKKTHSAIAEKPAKTSLDTITAAAPAPAVIEPVKTEPVSIQKKDPVSFDLFQNHQLQVKHNEPIPHLTPKEDWFPLVTIFIVFLFSLINLFYHKKFREFITSLMRRTVQGGREENIFTQRLRILLFVLFALITSSFFYQAALVYNVKPSKLTGFQFFSVILFLVFFTYLIKIISVRVMGFILRTEKEHQEYNNNILLFLNLLSFGLFPLVILIAFTPKAPADLLVKTGCVFIITAILFRIGRGFVLAVSNPLLSRFYLFLYLCTLEILPLVVILKIFVDQLL